MNQSQRREYLIRYLLNEKEQYAKIEIPQSEEQQKKLLRALFNVRMPQAVSDAFLSVQDAYLQEENQSRGITDYKKLIPIKEGIYLWQGDISTLQCDSIVNAANSQMLGCFQPNHSCIDNCIHTFAGVQLRQECAEMMQKQGHEEPTGTAKITAGYNLPAKHVLHTVGPIVHGRLTPEHETLLASCYTSCLQLAEQNELHSIAFCCISTGVFHFPQQRAAEIAIETVKRYKQTTGSKIDVIFNVFLDEDREIYKQLLA